MGVRLPERDAAAMPNYRRTWVPGGTYFFTVNLLERERSLLVTHMAALRSAFRSVRQARPFDVVAAVVLPDHLHCIWQLPPGDADNAIRWRQIKTLSSQSLPRTERRSTQRIARNERGIWQRRFWERLLRDDGDLHAHVHYIHFNPVKHGLVTRVCDWPYSTFHRYALAGSVPTDWGQAGAVALSINACPGERHV